MKPLTPDPELAEIVGAEPLSRAEVMKQVWGYIKANDLQDAKNRRLINADEKLGRVLHRKQVDMFEMTKLISRHLR